MSRVIHWARRHVGEANISTWCTEVVYWRAATGDRERVTCKRCRNTRAFHA